MSNRHTFDLASVTIIFEGVELPKGSVKLEPVTHSDVAPVKVFAPLLIAVVRTEISVLPAPEKSVCDDCDGSGEVIEGPIGYRCETCNGKGLI